MSFSGRQITVLSLVGVNVAIRLVASGRIQAASGILFNQDSFFANAQQQIANKDQVPIAHSSQVHSLESIGLQAVSILVIATLAVIFADTGAYPLVLGILVISLMYNVIHTNLTGFFEFIQHPTSFLPKG